MTGCQIEVFAKPSIVGILPLQPAVDELMDIVKVVLTSAARGVRCTRSIGVGHAMVPTIILPDGREDITVVSGQDTSKKLSPCLDIEIYVLAVAVWSTNTLIPGDLHKALLTGPTDGRWVAAAFLHRKRCKQDRRDAVNTPVFLERSDNVVMAGGKRSVPRTVQGHGNKLPNFDTRRRPAAASNATIDPVDVTVGAT